MRILVICQHYWPEPYPLPDICEELVRRGHQVDVVTDVPNYPMGKIYKEYKRGERRREVHKGVNIIRVFTVPRKHNAFFRLLNYYSYAISSTLYAKKLKKEYDVVFANQTSPVMMTTAAFAYAKKHKKKVVLYCMDLWPASLAAGGIHEDSIIYRFFGKQAKRLYNKADRILITSKMFRNYLTMEHGVAGGKICYLPQYANSSFEHFSERKSSKTTIDLVFAGNVGAAQSIGTILSAAVLLHNKTNLYWHIVGDGSELEKLREMARKMNLENIVFHGRKPSEEMLRYYAMADAMLVTLTADPLISLTLPGKVQTYMAAGKPILAAAIGEIPRVISEAECGYCATAEDAEGFANIVRQFLDQKDWEKLGKNAKAYYEQHFSKERFMNVLEYELVLATKQESIDGMEEVKKGCESIID